MLKSTYTTETMDRLFLELSQFTQATTAKELLFQAELSRSADELARLRAGIEAALADIERQRQDPGAFDYPATIAWEQASDKAAAIVRKHTGVTK